MAVLLKRSPKFWSKSLRQPRLLWAGLVLHVFLRGRSASESRLGKPLAVKCVAEGLERFPRFVQSN